MDTTPAAAAHPRVGAIDPVIKAVAMQAVYVERQALKENQGEAGDRNITRRVAQKHGLHERYLREWTDKLPAGLSGKALLRAALRLCFPRTGLKASGRRSVYTAAEFQSCVIGSLAEGGKVDDRLEYGIGRSNFMRTCRLTAKSMARTRTTSSLRRSARPGGRRFSYPTRSRWPPSCWRSTPRPGLAGTCDRGGGCCPG